MTQGLANSCKNRARLFYRYKSNPTDYRLKKYKAYRNKLNHLILSNKRQYFANQLQLAKDNLKNTWRIIGQAINKPQQKVSSFPTEFIYQNTKIKGNKDIANKFNDYFSTVGINLEKDITYNHPQY